MLNTSTRFRIVSALCICAVLAIFLGYFIASPLDWTAVGVFTGITFLLAFPILLRWHYLLLVASWNMNAVIFLLPGRPPLWLLMIAMSLSFSILGFILNREHKHSFALQITRPLIFLGAVMLITAFLRGGIGLGSFGSQISGGRRYFFVLAAILGYFALASNRIPEKRAYFYGILFFIGGVTTVISSLLPLVNPAFYVVFWIFPPEESGFEALGLVQEGTVFRLGGLSFASVALFCSLVAAYGIRGIFDLSGELNFLPFRFRNGFQVNKPWRLIFFICVVIASFFGGFRSVLVILSLAFFLECIYEKIYQTRLFFVFLLIGLLSAAFILPFATHLPLSVQRTLSVLPIEVDPVAKQSAQVSTLWRLEIWKTVLPDVPRYFFLGKGYGIDSKELEYLGSQASQGRDVSMQTAILAGDYHNGPLSVILPLGIFGLIAFTWFVIASIKALSRNYRYGAPSLRNINRFLLVYFITRSIYFFFVYGSLYGDLVMLTGIVGLGVALNGGVKSRNPAPAALEGNA
jgi:hypothetical protein